MFRTAAVTAVAVLFALVLGRMVFGVVGGMLALAWVALKILLIVGLAYFILTLVSPDAAKRVREAIGGTGDDKDPEP